jgi:hypothetical protein
MVTNREQGSAKLITKVIRLYTFMLSTTFRRPAIYPSSSPANIGTSALARIVVISIGLFFRPLRFAALDRAIDRDFLRAFSQFSRVHFHTLTALDPDARLQRSDRAVLLRFSSSSKPSPRRCDLRAGYAFCPPCIRNPGFRCSATVELQDGTLLKNLRPSAD